MEKSKITNSLLISKEKDETGVYSFVWKVKEYLGNIWDNPNSVYLYYQSEFRTKKKALLYCKLVKENKNLCNVRIFVEE
jgi:hypothetical protein